MAGGFPVFVREAKGARFTDVDGIEYVDFCLGDTGAMTGHAPDPTLRALAEQAAKGITLMLPSEEPATTEADVDLHREVFREAVSELARR